jgi:hypothetical protein
MTKKTKADTGILLILFLASLLVFSSCQESEEIKVDLIKIFVPNDFLEGFELFVIASDANGDVIDFMNMQRGDTSKLSSTNFEGNFTLSLVYTRLVDGDKYLLGSSFYNMKPGNTINFNNQGEIFLAFIELNNFNSTAAYYTLSSNDDLEYIQRGQTIVFLKFNREASRIFTTKYEGVPVGIPMSYSFPTNEYSSFEDNTLDFSTINTALTVETVNTENDETFVSLHGILGTGANRQIFQNIVSSYTTASSLDLKFPGTDFNSYASTTVLRNEDYDAFIFDKDSKYNFTTPLYTYSSDGTGPTFTFSISGGDWISVDADYNNVQPRNYYNFRTYIPTDFNQQINMVKLPQEIVSIFDQFNYQNWEFDHQSPAVVDYEDFSNPEEYLIASVRTGFNSFDHNSTSVVLYPNSESGRVGGRKRNYQGKWDFSGFPGQPTLTPRKLIQF